MGEISLSPDEYISYLEFSKNKHLLVEGSTDKKVFEFLLDNLFEYFDQKYPRDSFDIDNAENLIQGVGNREKVELLCTKIQNTPHVHKLVGFVDREYREFNLTNDIKDILNGHGIFGRVVWSRGHSIENYIFDLFILFNAFQIKTNTDYFQESFQYFERIFPHVIRLACACSLLADEIGEVKVLKRIIDWDILEISPDQVRLNFSLLKRKLIERSRLTSETNEIITRFYFWEEKVKQIDISCLRWLCHGHIGLRFIRSAFALCVFEICLRNCGNRGEARREIMNSVLNISEEDLSLTCFIIWIMRSLHNKCEFPKEVLALLDISFPNSEDI